MANKAWKVDTCTREIADGYVKKVSYIVSGTDSPGTFLATYETGEVSLPKPSTLVAYKDLTHDQVIGWVKAKLDADNAGTVAGIESKLDSTIAELKNPTEADGTPW